MTTTTVLAVGGSLSYAYVVEGWSAYLDGGDFDADLGSLISALVDAQRDRVNALLPEGCRWLPHTSEIIGPVGTDLDTDLLDAVFEEASEEGDWIQEAMAAWACTSDEGDYCPIEVTGTVLPIGATAWSWNNFDDAGLTHSCDECSDTELPGCVADLPEVAAASRRLKRWGFEQTYGPGDPDWNLSVAGNGAVPVPDDEVDAVMRAALGHTD